MIDGSKRSKIVIEGLEQYLVDSYAHLVRIFGYDVCFSKTPNVKFDLNVLVTEDPKDTAKRVLSSNPDLLLLTNSKGYDLFLKSYDVYLKGLPLVVVTSAKDIFLPENAYFLYRDCGLDHRKKLDDIIKLALSKK